MSPRLASSAGVLLAVLAMPAPAAAQAAAVRARATTIIAPPLAITTRQDFVLGSVLLRLPQMTRSLALQDPGVASLGGEIRSADLATPIHATFVLVGDAQRTLSIAVPRTIDLVRLGGSQTVRLAMRLDAGDLLAPAPRDGLRAFAVGGRLLLDGAAVAGDYRGTLAAVAQYD